MAGSTDKKQNRTISLKQAVVETLAFFDLFDFPLTLFEAWKYLPEKADIAAVAGALDCLKKEGVISEKDGFNYLGDKAALIRERLRRFSCARRKLKKARLVSRLFRLIPGIEMIAVGNMIGEDNLRDSSDIDLFIVVRDGKIWTTRLWCVLITKVLRLRPSPGKTKDTICLSFFVAEGGMNLSDYTLKPGADSRSMGSENRKLFPDPYFTYWLAGLEDVYDKGGVFEKFKRANSWINGLLPNLPIPDGTSKEGGEEGNDSRLGQLEKKLKALQLRMLAPEIRSTMNRDTRVVVYDHILKLHTNDRRQEYRDKWLGIISRLEI